MVSKEQSIVLKNKEYRNLLTGRFFLIIAFRMLATLLGWWVYELTNDPLAIGIIGLSEVIPAVSSALYAGHVIDNTEKKRMLLICNYCYVGLISLLLLPAFFSHQFNFTGQEITYFIYGVIFFTGICRAFLGPLVPSMIPKIVKKENLPAAITVNQATFLTASVSGHALGGFLIALITIKYTLVVIVCSMIVASLFFWTINKQPSFVDKTKKPQVFKSIKEGLTFIVKTKEILGAQMLDMFAVLFGGAVAMIPIFAKDILNVGAEGFGLLNAATDIGAIIMIITLSIFPLKKNQGKILLGVAACFGLCIIGFGLSKWYWMSFGFLLLSGMFDAVSVVIRGTIVQLKTPDELRGRVNSVNTMFIMSSNELGQFESGVMGRVFGVARSVVIGGTLTFLTAVFIGATSPKLRKMKY